MTTKAKRASIQIAGIEVEVFQLPSGEYIMSQVQVAEAVGKGESLLRMFLTTKQLKPLPHNDFSFAKTATQSDNPYQRGGVRDIKGIPIDIVSEFWMSQAFKRNVKAQALVSACMQEALQRRCDTAFGAVKSEQQYEQQSVFNRDSWEESRKFCREVHSSFTNSCIRWKFNAAQAHNEITLAVCGKTASELRELELINGTSDIGLNHVANTELLVKIARIKFQFSNYKKGGIPERVERALKDVGIERYLSNKISL